MSVGGLASMELVVEWEQGSVVECVRVCVRVVVWCDVWLIQ